MSRLAVVATFLGVAACTSRVDGTQDMPAETVSKVHEERQGPVRAVVDAALEVGDLSAGQRAGILAIDERVEAEKWSSRATKERLRASASDIVRSGSADSELFAAATKEAMVAIEQRMRITSDAMKGVHARLDARQRSAVATALRAQLAERYERKAKRAERRERFKKVVGYLMLNDAQVEGLKKLRKELVGEHGHLRPSRDELEALVAAFEMDDFEAAIEAYQAGKLKIMRERVVHAAEHANTALSMLTEEQRDLLADLIEFGPAAAGWDER
jgi:hypothetical protein